MLSEEEKKAIEYFKSNLEMTKEMGKRWGFQEEIKNSEIILNLIENQQKEIEEKTTILLAGAEKVKQLEKGNRSLMESRIKWKNRYYKEKAKNKDYISKDKIKEKIKDYDKWIKEGGDYTESLQAQKYALQELLEENNARI